MVYLKFIYIVFFMVEIVCKVLKMWNVLIFDRFVSMLGVSVIYLKKDKDFN